MVTVVLYNRTITTVLAMQNNQNIIVIDDSDEEDVMMNDENDQLLSELTKDQVIAMFDGFQVPPPHWSDSMVYPLLLDDAIRDEDAFLTDTVITDSNIANAGKGLFTTIDVPVHHHYPYSGVLKLKYQNHDSDEDVFYGSMKHRSVKTMLQPFLHLGIRMYVVGSYNSASTYMNDLDYGEKAPPSRTLNNCIIVGVPFATDPVTVGDFKKWLKNAPVRIETIVPVATGNELVTSYEYRCTVTELDDDASSNNDRDSDSDWEP